MAPQLQAPKPQLALHISPGLPKIPLGRLSRLNVPIFVDLWFARFAIYRTSARPLFDNSFVSFFLRSWNRCWLRVGTIFLFVQTCSQNMKTFIFDDHHGVLKGCRLPKTWHVSHMFISFSVSICASMLYPSKYFWGIQRASTRAQLKCCLYFVLRFWGLLLTPFWIPLVPFWFPSGSLWRKGYFLTVPVSFWLDCWRILA